MQSVWDLCANYLKTYGYPDEILPKCERYFTQWINLTLADNPSVGWWQTQLHASSRAEMIKIPCAMWLAAQLFNKRKELVQLIRDAEKPNVTTPGKLPEMRQRMLAALAWHQEERPKLERFIEIPDIDERFAKIAQDLSFGPPAKRQTVEKPLALYECGAEAIVIDKTSYVIGFFKRNGVKYFAVLHLLKTLGVSGILNDPVSRLMNEDEFKFIEGLSDATRHAIFGTLVDWRQQKIIRVADIQTIADKNPVDLCGPLLRYLHKN